MKKYITILVFLIAGNIKSQPSGCSLANNVAGNPGTSGLYGEYFAGYFADATSFFTGTISATNRIETNLNYTNNNWGAIVPPAAGTTTDPNSYSARYRGSIYIATSAVYSFSLTSDDASYMWIDNDALVYPAVTTNAFIKNGGLHGDITVSNTISLSSGFHNIQIQYGEQNSGNHLIFKYESSALTITPQVVPNSILCTAIQPSVAVSGVTPPTDCTCNAGVTTEFFTGYFNDVQTYFSSQVSVINRTDPIIGFSTDGGWGLVCPPLSGTNASPETYSTRFSGQFYVPVTTSYTLFLTSDDASYLWIDAAALSSVQTNTLALINNGGLHSATTVSATAILSAGLHNFKIHYGENTGNNVCYLEYASTGAGIAKQFIPQAAYCSCMAIAPLPIELINFTAEAISDEEVALTWITATEKNNKQFDIERSIDGINFSKIASVPSKGLYGNSLTILNYNETDPAPELGTSYYRLKQSDFDGAFNYYNIVSVHLGKKKDKLFYASPNPNSGEFVLTINGIRKSQSVEVMIYSVSGLLVYNKLIEASLIQEKESILNLNVKLAQGAYIALCLLDGKSYPIKLIVN